ncbi:MAG: tyrosinase family protein [Bacteroidota bacterium]
MKSISISGVYSQFINLCCNGFSWFILLFLFLLLVQCSEVPLPDSTAGVSRDMPVIEIQINDTETTADDYVNATTAASCRMRLLNPNSFGSDITVRLQNIDLLNEKIRFSLTSAGTYANFLITDIPEDGSWSNLYILGIGSNMSSIDKDAVIEVKENRVNLRNIVLARKALMTTTSPPINIVGTFPEIEVQINGNATTIDDYITWSPFFCRARIVNHSAFSTDLNVRLQNASFSGSKVLFADEGSLDPTVNAMDNTVTDYHTANNATLNISLASDGSWKEFYVAGNSSVVASAVDKDAVMEVRRISDNANLGRWGLMVRIRKNAQTMLSEERYRFLNAIRELQPRGGVTFDRYNDFIDQHIVGTNEAHTAGGYDGDAFLPWHRTYLLRLERDLQALDPSVALPYWKFDAVANNLFSPDFLGQRSAGSFVTLNSTNPLFTWTIGTSTGIRRRPSFNDQIGYPTGIRTEADVFALGSDFDSFRTMEGNPHGSAHTSAAGPNGWIRNFFSSPRDPLFFLLHCNVDRLWAKWQIRQRKTIHPNFIEGYSAQGDFASAPPGHSVHIGHYLEDTMWPWNESSGTGTNGIGDRPTTSYGPFPSTQGHILALPKHPRPFDMIDYRNTRTNPNVNPYVNNGLGFAYDDVVFQSAL